MLPCNINLTETHNFTAFCEIILSSLLNKMQENKIIYVRGKMNPSESAAGFWLMPRKSGIDRWESLYHVYWLCFAVLRIKATCPHSHFQIRGKKILRQVMKYEDLLNWKNKCFWKYCSTELNWQSSASIIIYCEGPGRGGWHTAV